MDETTTQNPITQSPTNKAWLDTPKAIVIGALLIGVGLAVGLSVSGNNQGPEMAQVPGPEENLFEVEPIKIAKDDHVFGNPDAPVVVFEYSDIDCPFCARVHPTLTRLVNENPDTVAWVYRHNPLAIHPHAGLKAEATECVADIAGEDAFWEYLDVLFTEQGQMQGDEETVLGMLVDAATPFGVDTEAFSKCMQSDRHLKKIVREQAEAAQEGTPYNVMVGPHTAVAVRGALPYDAFAQIADGLANEDPSAEQ